MSCDAHQRGTASQRVPPYAETRYRPVDGKKLENPEGGAEEEAVMRQRQGPEYREGLPDNRERSSRYSAVDEVQPEDPRIVGPASPPSKLRADLLVLMPLEDSPYTPTSSRPAARRVSLPLSTEGPRRGPPRIGMAAAAWMGVLPARPNTFSSRITLPACLP